MVLVQVLGPGCARCAHLQKNVEEAVKQLGIQAQIEKVSDINVIMGFGVMMTPALAIDGELKLQGKVASVEEIKQLLSAVAG
jgi:small redox-active disulfide protein 2